MDENFTNIVEKIERRRSAIIEALKREEEAIKKAEATLTKHYEKSIQSVLNLSISNMEKQENELINEFTEELYSIRKAIQILLPVILFLGILIGIIGTAYYYRNYIEIDKSKIIQSEDGKVWLNITKTKEE